LGEKNSKIFLALKNSSSRIALPLFVVVVVVLMMISDKVDGNPSSSSSLIEIETEMNQ